MRASGRPAHPRRAALEASEALRPASSHRTGRRCIRRGRCRRRPRSRGGSGRTWRRSRWSGSAPGPQPGIAGSASSTHVMGRRRPRAAACGRDRGAGRSPRSLFKGQILGGQARAPSPGASARACGGRGLAEMDRAQHQGVDEEADQPLGLGARAAGDTAPMVSQSPRRPRGGRATRRPARTGMNRVLPRPARDGQGGGRLPASKRSSVAPRKLRTAGRGRSAGSSRGSSPASRFCQ